MTDLLLTHSYHLYYDRKQTRKMQPYPPLGTLYAAALLRSAGLSVALFDTMLNDPELGFESALAEHRPRVVVVYEDNFNFLSKMCLTRMREVAWEIAKTARASGATVSGKPASCNAITLLKGRLEAAISATHGACSNTPSSSLMKSPGSIVLRSSSVGIGLP